MHTLNSPSDARLHTEFDFVFAGAGASCALLLLELHRTQALQGKRVLLVDPTLEDAADKTFCFWAEEGDAIVQQLSSAIEHSWGKLVLPSGDVEDLGSMRYYHLSSRALQEQLRLLEKSYGWERKVARVESVQQIGECYQVLVNGEWIQANFVFDSRTPKFQPEQAGETHLLQSFVGWVIETPSASQQLDTFRMMDFNVEQDAYTQFVYALPFSDRTALVEVTRFGDKPITRNEAEAWLKEYISRSYTEYTVVEVEVGCIPMSTASIERKEKGNAIPLGARGYKVKPSTGYAFKNMFYHAKEVAVALKNNKPLSHAPAKATKPRFAFYDGLLLHILKQSPEKGKGIFEQLFHKVEPKLILRFLDERTTIREDVFIFSKLPWSPFLRALGYVLKVQPAFRSVVLLAIAVLLLCLGFKDSVQQTAGYSLLLLGLIAVGIPHGAVDHLLETGNWQSKKTVPFIGSYLFQMLLMALLWLLWPSLALVGFVVYSAWHFGQADGVQWKLTKGFSFLWGASVLFYILGTHRSDTNAITEMIGSLSLPFSLPYWSLLPWAIWAVVKKKSAMLVTVIWLTLSSQLPLLFAFGLYFIGQHSLTSWGHIANHLQMSHKRIWLQSLPFHAGAWSLLLLFYFFWPLSGPWAVASVSKWGVFFIFIACISFPHAVSMHAMYKSKVRSS